MKKFKVEFVEKRTGVVVVTAASLEEAGLKVSRFELTDDEVESVLYDNEELCHITDVNEVI